MSAVSTKEKLMGFLFPWVAIHLGLAMFNLILIIFRLAGLKFGFSVDLLLYFFILVGLGVLGLVTMMLDFWRFMSLGEESRAEESEEIMSLDLDEEGPQPRKASIAWFYNLVLFVDHAFLIACFPYPKG